MGEVACTRIRNERGHRFDAPYNQLPLMKELAGAISEGLLVGETLHRQLAAYPFYKSIGFNDSTRSKRKIRQGVDGL